MVYLPLQCLPWFYQKAGDAHQACKRRAQGVLAGFTALNYSFKANYHMTGIIIQLCSDNTTYHRHLEFSNNIFLNAEVLFKGSYMNK